MSSVSVRRSLASPVAAIQGFARSSFTVRRPSSCSSFPCAAVCPGLTSQPPVNAATCDLGSPSWMEVRSCWMLLTSRRAMHTPFSA
eukprot:scaffold131879_cov60-Phaeocystis_antarctica.AAC.1